MDVAEIVGDRFTVQFPRNGDRFGHSILRNGRPIACSVEGDDSDDWPPSPPLQQLSIEDLGSGPVGLLVGMAGRSHWSLSIELQGDEIVFDAACRVRGEVGDLGSAYRLQGDGEQLGWTVDEGPAFAAADLVSTADEVTIRITDTAPAGGTIRWRYRLTLG